MLIKQVLFVFIGGGVGACLRFLLTIILPNSSYTFPWATFIANMLGCLLIGLISGWLIKSELIRSDLSFLLLTGFCGGFTTFSTFSHESYTLFKTNQYTQLFLYNASSIFFGVLLVGIGYLMSKN